MGKQWNIRMCTERNRIPTSWQYAATDVSYLANFPNLVLTGVGHIVVSIAPFQIWSSMVTSAQLQFLMAYTDVLCFQNSLDSF